MGVKAKIRFLYGMAGYGVCRGWFRSLSIGQALLSDHTGYSRPAKPSHRFRFSSFLYTDTFFSFELGARTGQTDGRTRRLIGRCRLGEGLTADRVGQLLSSR